jgi:hypothetical protein
VTIAGTTFDGKDSPDAIVGTVLVPVFGGVFVPKWDLIKVVVQSAGGGLTRQDVGVVSLNQVSCSSCGSATAPALMQTADVLSATGTTLSGSVGDAATVTAGTLRLAGGALIEGGKGRGVVLTGGRFEADGATIRDATGEQLVVSGDASLSFSRVSLGAASARPVSAPLLRSTRGARRTICPASRSRPGTVLPVWRARPRFVPPR